MIIEKSLTEGGQTETPTEDRIEGAASGISLFDEAELLENFDDDRDFAKSILSDALSEIPKELDRLIESCAKEQCAAISDHAHTIKGMAGNLFTPALRDIAFNIEKAAKAGDLQLVRGLMPEMEQTVRLTLEVFKVWR